MQRIRQRKKKKFYRKIYFIPKFIPNLSALFGLGILKSVIAVYVRAVRSGCLLSYKMEIIYGRQLLLVGACGNEDWQMLPFCLDAQSGIVSDCENAKEYRKLIGLQI